jgi:hypothetical protein
MGQRLVEYYAEAAKQAGLEGKIKLALITRISSVNALAEPDSPSNIELFRKALEEVKKAS